MNRSCVALLSASLLVLLTGCAGGGSPSTCEVMSPAQISLPTNQNDQRVEAQSTGEPMSDSHEQNCP
ncbi:hypothetical protein [Pseudomonas sp. GV071]|jgi:hypothetical protein|uniref:hypothetical protein n=1 Tax=Pseudomonas sp. GV071 TaxID=2135754 RepID=UPI000D378948|nr:hypothetical protein [Pseudomonas sp. GV071]PTQ72844.1 hypothetical protein C8K61_10251 [Pseudomonas sp. GV071]